MRVIVALGLSAPVILLACRPAGPDLEAERSAILRADSAWVAAAGRGDLEQTLGYWTDDAIVLPPDLSALEGKAAIREYVATGFQTPGFSISWKSGEITVSVDGRMAYQLATNQITVPDSTGALHTSYGKGVVVWRKEPDGAWRAVVDIWNGVAPPAPGAAGEN
jgi:ketosteroid isomerase-like protein